MLLAGNWNVVLPMLPGSESVDGFECDQMETS